MTYFFIYFRRRRVMLANDTERSITIDALNDEGNLEVRPSLTSAESFEEEITAPNASNIGVTEDGPRRSRRARVEPYRCLVSDYSK